MKPLSHRLSALEPSATVLLDSAAKKMIDAGEDVINLCSGEPFEPPPVEVMDAVCQAVRQGKTKYSHPTGILELKEAVSDKFRSENGLSYSPDLITITSGVKHALFNALSALLNPGDEVLIPKPYWVTYPSIVRLLGASPVFVEGDPANHFKITADSLAASCTAKSKCLLLNSPCNPTGAVYTQKELERLAEIMVKNDLYCVSDEIYEHLIYDNGVHTSPASLDSEMLKRTVVINGVSKAYAMTGYRIGYIASHGPLSKLLNGFQSQTTHHPSMPAQYGALEALKSGRQFTQGLKKSLELKRDQVREALTPLANLDLNSPQGAFYFFIPMAPYLKRREAISDSLSLCEYLLDQHGVATVPGIGFGQENYLRISFTASPENLGQGLARIVSGLTSL